MVCKYWKVTGIHAFSQNAPKQSSSPGSSGTGGTPVLAQSFDDKIWSLIYVNCVWIRISIVIIKIFLIKSCAEQQILINYMSKKREILAVIGIWHLLIEHRKHSLVRIAINCNQSLKTAKNEKLYLKAMSRPGQDKPQFLIQFFLKKTVSENHHPLGFGAEG